MFCMQLGVEFVLVLGVRCVINSMCSATIHMGLILIMLPNQTGDDKVAHRRMLREKRLRSIRDIQSPRITAKGTVYGIVFELDQV